MGSNCKKLSPRALELSFFCTRLDCVFFSFPSCENSHPQLFLAALLCKYARSNPKMFHPVMISTSCRWT